MKIKIFFKIGILFLILNSLSFYAFAADNSDKIKDVLFKWFTRNPIIEFDYFDLNLVSRTALGPGSNYLKTSKHFNEFCLKYIKKPLEIDNNSIENNLLIGLTGFWIFAFYRNKLDLPVENIIMYEDEAEDAVQINRTVASEKFNEEHTKALEYAFSILTYVDILRKRNGTAESEEYKDFINGFFYGIKKYSEKIEFKPKLGHESNEIRKLRRYVLNYIRRYMSVVRKEYEKYEDTIKNDDSITNNISTENGSNVSAPLKHEQENVKINVNNNTIPADNPISDKEKVIKNKSNEPNSKKTKSSNIFKKRLENLNRKPNSKFEILFNSHAVKQFWGHSESCQKNIWKLLEGMSEGKMGEKLKTGDNTYSFRINLKNRLVYVLSSNNNQPDKTTITVIQCKGHYKD